MSVVARFSASAIMMAAALLAAGCTSAPQLMPTPNLYTRGDVDPFSDEVPVALRNNHVDVLYLTDRQPMNDSPDDPQYGFKRSRSLAFGVSEVQFGKDVSWDDLVAASRTKERKVDLEMSVAYTKEICRFPSTPKALVELPDPLAATTQPPTWPSSPVLREEVDAAKQAALDEFTARLAKVPDKEVYVFVHGYNNNFNDSVMTLAQLWHFFGRKGVPVAYSWPAGRGGLLRGYTYDSTSSEFTVYHLKEALRTIAFCPDVKKVNIIAHSRGTGITVDALRKLHLEIGGGGHSTRDVLKLGTVVLCAPDIDLDVMIQRFTTARLGRVPERFALYVCANDNALGISQWLMGGLRLGELRSDLFTPEELAVLRTSKTVQIIDARVSNAGSFGHDYFHSNPAVSSDLILLMRYRVPPGAEYGRPLRVVDDGFWIIDDSYPGSEPLPIFSKDKPTPATTTGSAISP